MSCGEIHLRFNQLLDEVEEEEESLPPGSEDEEDHLSLISQDSGSEQEKEDHFIGGGVNCGGQPEESLGKNANYYLGRDGKTKWNKTAPEPNELAHSFDAPMPEVKLESQTVSTPVECWQLFFTEEMLQLILVYTNIKIDEIVSNSQGKIIHSYMKKSSFKELKALIGLLYLTGIFKSSGEKLKDLWRTDGTGVAIFYSTMSYQRFYFLQNSLRFDNIETRAERAQFDKLAAIREIFYEFVENCKNIYTPSQYCIIGERLDSFLGRCSFRQYMPSKPAKFGIKSFILADAKTFYTVNMEIYAGAQPDGPYKMSNESFDIVDRLIQPICGSSRNVTFGHKYGDYDTVFNLFNQHKLTAVCPLKRNKPEIPLQFLDKDRDIYSNMFGFQNDISIVSYVPKKGKNYILLSSLHHESRIDPSTGEENKAEITTFYNSTKGGVDKIDQICSHYDLSRNSKRWSLTIFYSLLNIAGINSAVVHRFNNFGTEITSRKEFLRQLGLDLVREFLRERKDNSRIFRSIRNKISVRFGNENPGPYKLQRPARCDECPRSKDRKTKYVCEQCNKRLCLEHIRIFCERCSAFQDPEEEFEPTFELE